MSLFNGKHHVLHFGSSDQDCTEPRTPIFPPSSPGEMSSSLTSAHKHNDPVPGQNYRRDTCRLVVTVYKTDDITYSYFLFAPAWFPSQSRKNEQAFPSFVYDLSVNHALSCETYHTLFKPGQRTSTLPDEAVIKGH